MIRVVEAASDSEALWIVVSSLRITASLASHWHISKTLHWQFPRGRKSPLCSQNDHHDPTRNFEVVGRKTEKGAKPTRRLGQPAHLPVCMRESDPATSNAWRADLSESETRSDSDSE
jgi:hypothetical protein